MLIVHVGPGFALSSPFSSFLVLSACAYTSFSNVKILSNEMKYFFFELIKTKLYMYISDQTKEIEKEKLTIMQNKANEKSH